MDDNLSDIFEDREFGGDDLFAILEGLEDFTTDFPPINDAAAVISTTNSSKGKVNEEASRLVSQKSTSSCSAPPQDSSETELEVYDEVAASSPKSKRQKVASSAEEEQQNQQDGQQRMSHITVERNRRKQMNEHLSVLRSLMPCFYVKRGDQASIIGGVVDYINELQQVLQALEAKKQRKVVYSDVLSPRVAVSSPRPSPLSPRTKPPLSPRLNLPISPRTPQPGSPYRPRLHHQQITATAAAGYNVNISSSSNSNNNNSPHHHHHQVVVDPSPITTTTPSSSSSASSINDNINELVANSKSPIADVEVKFSGPHVLLKTVSQRIPGQALKIISALEDLALEIIHLNITTTADETMLNSFTIKIGIECQLSADELAQQILQTFC